MINRDFVCLRVSVCVSALFAGLHVSVCLGEGGEGGAGGEGVFYSSATLVGDGGRGQVALRPSVERLSVPSSIPTCQLDGFK